MIGGPITSAPMIEEEEEEIFLEDVDPTLPAAHVPLASLSEKEQLMLALKASIDTVREEQTARVASFSFDRLALGLLPEETSITIATVEERAGEGTRRRT